MFGHAHHHFLTVGPGVVIVGVPASDQFTDVDFVVEKYGERGGSGGSGGGICGTCGTCGKAVVPLLPYLLNAQRTMCPCFAHFRVGAKYHIDEF